VGKGGVGYEWKGYGQKVVGLGIGYGSGEGSCYTANRVAKSAIALSLGPRFFLVIECLQVNHPSPHANCVPVQHGCGVKSLAFWACGGMNSPDPSAQYCFLMLPKRRLCTDIFQQ